MRNSHQPFWTNVEIDEFGPLDKNTSADVVVVGGGIAGMSVAYLLAREGRKVVVLDDGPIGGGQTSCTSAHLASALDDRYVEIERLHGGQGSRLAAESHTAAIDKIEEIIAEERIDCDFRRVDGYLFAPPEGDQDLLDREYEAASRAGSVQVSRAGRVPLRFDTGPCLIFHNQAQFHPLKYLAGVAKAFTRLGGRVFQSHAESIDGGPHASVKVKGGKQVEASAIVVATNTPVNDMLTMHTKQSPYMSYCIAAPVPAGTIPHALYWDTADPYHYVRLQPLDETHDLLIVGGEDHKTGQATDGMERYARLVAWARGRFLAMGRVRHRWSGQVMETVDGLAFIGRNPGDHDNVYIVTGDSGMGLTHGTIAGILLTDLIVGRENPWTELYDPARKRVGAAWEFAKENFNVAAQYLDHLTPGEIDDVSQVEPGSGAILRRGLHKIAVHRTQRGRLVTCSANCPHLGCVVQWNPDEQTWDCPCHGSRFSAEGKVMVGPANSDLAPVEVEEHHPAGRHSE